ncbi:hypothetical protein C8Q75DRAFT_803032 [Abortiporus biennis]|nr:hypothetical protein C8Q75DRAFT_803032 [Abortiporus biennis]
MNRVLSIPEMVEIILTFCDNNSNAMAARVCKKWSDIALNILWRDVTDISRLLVLLAPLRNVALVQPDDHPEDLHRPAMVLDGVEFERNIELHDWDRFNKYAKRVRFLGYSEYPPSTEQPDISLSPTSPPSFSKSTYIHQCVFDEIARTRLSLHILPNLHSLVWVSACMSRMRLSLLFSHPDITDLGLYLHNPPPNVDATHTEPFPSPLNIFLSELPHRMPNLTSLDLRFKFPVRHIEKVVTSSLLPSLPALKRVIFPLFTLSSSIMSALSKLPHIRVVQFEFMENQGMGDIRDIMTFSPVLEQGAFRSLCDLSLSVRLPDMIKFLQMDFCPGSFLTSLYVHLVEDVVTDPNGEMKKFFEAVVENCQLLKHLYIDLLVSHVDLPTPIQPQPVPVAEYDKRRLTFHTLQPLLSLPTLTTFELRWTHPLKLTRSELEILARRLGPSLEVLLLNCEPMDPSVESELGLDILRIFAKECPRLIELGVYVDATIPIERDLDEDLKFKSLQRLTLGLSKVQRSFEPAMFLSSIFPLSSEGEVVLTSGVTWPEGFGIFETTENRGTLDELQNRAKEWWEVWKEVGKLIPMFSRVREDERRRIQSRLLSNV